MYFVFQFVKDPEFHKIVKRDALETKDREDIDSVSVIDDITAHIPWCPTSPNETASQAKVELITEMLKELGIWKF